MSAVFARLNRTRTWFRCYTVVQTSRSEVPLPAATETRLRGLSCEVLQSAATLRPHQGIGWEKELSI